MVPIRATQKTPSETYNFEPSLSDVMLYSMFFFQDLARIRALIRELWSGYSQGRTALITATLVTNTAIELIQRNVEELFATMAEWRHLEIPDQHKWAQVALRYICIATGTRPGEQLYDPALDFVCGKTFALVNIFLAVTCTRSALLKYAITILRCRSTICYSRSFIT